MHSDIIEAVSYNKKIYKRYDGIYYHAETPDKMIKILHNIRKLGTRVRFHWGDVETGSDWGDDYGVKGTISNSTGPVKIPILIHNRRSHGGGAILTDSIVKITETQGGRVIYQHPKYHVNINHYTPREAEKCQR